MGPNITLHVGFSKTATTSLQNFVFSRLPGLANLGKPFVNGDQRQPLYEAITHLTFAEELRYDKAETESAFARAIAGRSGPILISSEGFTYSRHNDQALVARRLRSIFPAARIVFTIREQVAWIRSLYLDDCGRFPLRKPMPRFATWLGWEKGKRNRGALQMANFDATVRLYEELFGRERVFVLPHEKMLSDRQGFANSLASVLEVEQTHLDDLLASLPRSNPAISAKAYHLGLLNYYLIPEAGRRLLERLPRSIKNLILSGEPPELDIPETAVELVGANVRAGNGALAERHGLDLRGYGYLL